MKLTSAWITEPQLQAVFQALHAKGFQAFLVGGCVRNALIGAGVTDIDIATDALPLDTIACAKAAGLKAVPTGIDHGTITVISGGIPHEITTFRSDVETDGRHATVQFSKDIAHDAARRDFTMNALYASAQGDVIDPLGGLPDLNARHVRFIGDGGHRIREDYLRSLRFFRFFAWYGDPSAGIDADGLAAVAGNLDGLHSLSRERVGAELKKLLAAPDPGMAVAAMRTSGVLGAVLPGSDDRGLPMLLHFEQELCAAPSVLRRLAVLGGDPAAVLRLSKTEARTLAILQDGIGSMQSAAHLAYLYGAVPAFDIMLLRSALFEQPVPPGIKSDIALGAAVKFPIRAADLIDRYQGPALGIALKEREARWIASGFKLTREALLT